MRKRIQKNHLKGYNIVPIRIMLYHSEPMYHNVCKVSHLNEL